MFFAQTRYLHAILKVHMGPSFTVNIVKKPVYRAGAAGRFDEFCDFSLMDAWRSVKKPLTPVGRESFDCGDFILNSHCKSSFGCGGRPCLTSVAIYYSRF